MKTAALIFMAFAVWSAASRGKKSKSCFTWPEKRQMQMMKMAMTCEQPMGQLVTLDTPSGFDYVTPSMKKVAMCSNMLCWGKNKKCEATETRNITVKVEAVKLNDEMEVESVSCTAVEVVEHVACACGCATKEKDCNERETYFPQMCSCMCKKELRDKCVKDKMMWNPDNCMCTCFEGVDCKQTD